MKRLKRSISNNKPPNKTTTTTTNNDMSQKYFLMPTDEFSKLVENIADIRQTIQTTDYKGTIESLISHIETQQKQINNLTAKVQNLEAQMQTKIENDLLKIKNNSEKTKIMEASKRTFLEVASGHQKSIHVELQTTKCDYVCPDWILRNTLMPEKCKIQKIIKLNPTTETKVFKLTLKVPLNRKLVEFIGPQSEHIYPPNTAAKKFNFKNVFVCKYKKEEEASKVSASSEQTVPRS